MSILGPKKSTQQKKKKKKKCGGGFYPSKTDRHTGKKQTDFIT